MAMSRSIRSRSSADNSDWAAEGDTVLSSHWAYRTHQLQRAGAGSVVHVRGRTGRAQSRTNAPRWTDTTLVAIATAWLTMRARPSVSSAGSVARSVPAARRAAVRANHS